MTLDELREKIRRWDSSTSGPGKAASSYYHTIISELDYHSVRDWKIYLPAEHTDNNANYMERLANWIGNLTDEKDQKLLLEYALQISFFSHEDFIALYRTAYNREVLSWIVKMIGANLQNGLTNFQRSIDEIVHRHTWFCPVTDSMDINEFYKTNHLQGIGHRPGFATLQMLAENCAKPDDKIATNLIYYMNNPSLDPSNPSHLIEYIVLLEDIVGSGSQCYDSIKWVTKNLSKPILFIPLIICPEGIDNLKKLETQSNGLLTVRPVIQLYRGDLLGPKRGSDKLWSKTEEMEQLVDRCNKQNPFTYEAFGYRNTGCSLVTFTNTPDNTIPLVHDIAESGSWKPLFPRVYRDS